MSEAQGASMLQEAAAMTAEYGSMFAAVLSEAVASLGTYVGAGWAFVWLYLLEASGVFSDPCVIIVIGFAILIYTVVSGLSYASRKAYNHFRLPKEQEVPLPPAEVPETQISEAPLVQDSDFEGGNSMNGMCYCPQNPGMGEFDQFDFEATPQEGVVAKMIRWANIAFAGQLIDSACIPNCMGYMNGGPCSPGSDDKKQGGKQGTNLAEYYNQQKTGKEGGHRGQPPEDSLQRPCHGDERRESGYHTHRHKHRHSHSCHGRPRGNQMPRGGDGGERDGGSSSPPDSPPQRPPPPHSQPSPNKRGNGWFGSWFAHDQPAPGGPPQPMPQDTRGDMCKKPKCACACKRKHSRESTRQDYQSGLRGSRSKPVPTQSEKYRRKPAPPGSQGSNFRRSEHSTRQGLSPGGGRGTTSRRTEWKTVEHHNILGSPIQGVSSHKRTRSEHNSTAGSKSEEAGRSRANTQGETLEKNRK